jgi:hypothetical protein
MRHRILISGSVSLVELVLLVSFVTCVQLAMFVHA